MSWKPLKRLSKTSSRSSPSGELDEKTIEEHVSKFVRLERDTKRLHNDAKKYEDTMLALYHCEKKMSSDLASGELCNESPELRRLVEEWLGFASSMDTAVDDHLVAVRRCLVDPLKRYQSVFSEVQAALKRRDQAVQECLRLEQRVERLGGRESTGPNLARLSECRQAVETARAELTTMEALLAQDLPRWYEAGSLYLQPCLEAFVHSQTLHWGQATTRAHDLMAPGPRSPVRAALGCCQGPPPLVSLPT
uniref:Putative bridging integrator 3 n=1 Tax=Amblyomma parvum TaxID=251391 RepID=A0A023FUU0_AMBPA